MSWGLWTGIGFAATAGGREAQRRFAEQGVNGFSPTEGLRALDVLLKRPVAHAAVLNADWDAVADRHSYADVWPLLRGFSVSVEKEHAATPATCSLNSFVVPMWRNG